WWRSLECPPCNCNGWCSPDSCLFPGKQLALLKTNSAVRTCGFDFGGNIIMFSTDKQMGYQCFVSFFDLRDPSQIDNNEPYMKIPCNDSKITSAVWGPLGECIIAGHESGELNQYSAKVRGHMGPEPTRMILFFKVEFLSVAQAGVQWRHLG
ncbi:PREDICTED: eukaryotic translation initiation factor 3 subunit I-like, partial [Cercocebus atys]|uniref:eukaryotic translation initiation factor 3 subunit I-like n=1 Tax=Cercocebus atys TaxID=9531 RepID=UPI0005F577BC